MIDDLKPYPETKDSGLAWLGDIPAHWEIKRNGSLFQQRNAAGEPDWPIPEVSLRTGVRIREFGTSKRKQVMSDKAKYKCATKGDYVYNMMRMWQGAAGIAPVDGLVSPAYVVAKPLPHTNPAYFASLFRTDDYLAEIDAFSRGIVKDRKRLYWDQFKQIPTPCPPPAEQAAIARFLAWATNRLDRAIGAKRRIIALLQEQKQAIIHRAVTRGLDPSVPLKDSGIPWLGEIPEHWEVHRAKHLFREIDERSTLGSEELLSVSHMTGVTPRSQKSITMFKAASYAGHKLCQPGDLVVNTMWAWMGALGTSAYSGIISPAYAVYRPRQMAGICSSYIDCLLRSAPYIANIICQSTGLHTSRLRLYPEAFFRLPINLPPHQEQLLIVDSLKADTAGLNSTIFRLESEINLLLEYRTCLIANVVTGKLDVRKLAARLPEEELQDQPDVAAGYDADEAEDDAESDLIDPAET